MLFRSRLGASVSILAKRNVSRAKLAWRILLGAFTSVVAALLVPGLAESPPSVAPATGNLKDGDRNQNQTPTPILGGFPAFPNSIFNKDIASMPVASYSSAVIHQVGDSGLHADFGTMSDGLQNGIPVNVNGAVAARVVFDYVDESDPGPYLFPSVPNIEGTVREGEQADVNDGRDHHCLTVGKDGKLYELYQARKLSNGSWHAASGAIWTLSSNRMRPAGWTSSDAAGLPIAPLLMKYAEVKSGTISHALRVTLNHTHDSYVWPASHRAGGSSRLYPPMGARFRLHRDFDVSPYPKDVRVILDALKRYGMIVADNGSNGFIQGEPSPQWNADSLSSIGRVHLSDFDIVDESAAQLTPNSYAAH